MDLAPWTGTIGRPSLALCLLFNVLALAGCNSGCSGDGCITGSGHVVSQERKVDHFTAIRLESIGDLTVERTGTDSVIVTTDDNLQPIVTSEVKNGTLVLAESRCHDCSPTKIAFKVMVSDLNKIDLPSTGSADIAKLDTSSFAANVSGTGSLKLSGKADALKIDISGTGTCDARDLVAKRATVNVSGTGDARVNATDELEATVSGTGSIRYAGSPKLTQSVSGTGSIKHD